MASGITERQTASIPPFDIKIEENPIDNWIAQLRESGKREPVHLGTFDSDEKAREASTDYIRKIYKEDNKEFPKAIAWTREKAFLRPKPEELSVSNWLYRAAPIVTFVVFLVWAIFVPKTDTTTSSIKNQTEDIRKISIELSATRTELEALKSSLQASPNPPNDIKSITGDLEVLRRRLESFEAILGDNLERRLAVPILRKDLDAVKEQNQIDIASVNSRLNLIFDIMKWLIGALGVSGIISSFMGRSRKEKTVQEKAT